MSDLDSLREALAPRYEVEREIGRGGMSQVFLAHDRKHDRKVALKVVDAAVAEGIAVERFLREIQLCARLTHPHILPLLDSGFAADRPYYVMPYVSGESLRERMDRLVRMPVDETVKLAREVADALDYAHAAGVIHRDVKPENILLLGDHAMVLDFGVGRAISAASEEREALTMVGTILGTPAYMSPEQAAGDVHLDGRSDEYSLAVMLFEMLTGGQPFTGPSLQAVIAKRFRETPPPVNTVREDVPEHVAAALVRALSLEQDDRFPTLGKFAQALATATREGRVTPAGGAGLPSIAVLPFANVGGDPENEFFSDGITDEVISALSRLRILRVAARTSSYALRGVSEDVGAIGARLKVGNVLEGSVRRAGRRVRVMVRLVSARDGFQIWSETFDRDVEEVFTIQDEISAEVARTLAATLPRDAPARGAPSQVTSVEAYELYLKGRFFWNKRTEADLIRATELFTAAVEHDPRYAPAYAGLADAWAVLGTYGACAPRQAMPLARENAERALAIDPSLAEAHATIALVLAVYERKWGEAESAFRRAITLDPGSPKARQWLAVALLSPMGRFTEARAEIGRALILDPLSLIVKASVGLVHALGREFDAAIGHYLDALALEPAFGIGHFFLAQALLAANRPAEATTAVERAMALTGGSPEMISVFAQARQACGDERTARAKLEELERLRESRYVSAALIAQVEIALDEPVAAMEWLTRAEQEGDAELVYLRARPIYDSLTGRPEFRALTARVGFTTDASGSS